MAGKRKNRPKRTVREELAVMSAWQEDHGKEDMRNFADLRRKMGELPTKDDLSVIGLEMASKQDLKSLRDLFFDEKGQPRFASRTDMEPVLRIYQGSVFTKSLVLGAAAVIGAIVGIGYGLITITSWLTQRPPTP